MSETRIGGRQKGTPNRRTSELLDSIAEKYPGYCPVLSMIELAIDPSTPIDVKLDCHKQIAPYLRPKLKSIEVSGLDGEPLELMPTMSLNEAARYIDYLMVQASHEHG